VPTLSPSLPVKPNVVFLEFLEIMAIKGVEEKFNTPAPLPVNKRGREPGV
jgi:hypothetical protein